MKHQYVILRSNFLCPILGFCLFNLIHQSLSFIEKSNLLNVITDKLDLKKAKQ